MRLAGRAVALVCLPLTPRRSASTRAAPGLGLGRFPRQRGRGSRRLSVPLRVHDQAVMARRAAPAEALWTAYTRTFAMVSLGA